MKKLIRTLGSVAAITLISGLGFATPAYAGDSDPTASLSIYPTEISYKGQTKLEVTGSDTILAITYYSSYGYSTPEPIEECIDKNPCFHKPFPNTSADPTVYKIYAEVTFERSKYTNYVIKTNTVQLTQGGAPEHPKVTTVDHAVAVAGVPAGNSFGPTPVLAGTCTTVDNATLSVWALDDKYHPVTKAMTVPPDGKIAIPVPDTSYSDTPRQYTFKCYREDNTDDKDSGPINVYLLDQVKDVTVTEGETAKFTTRFNGDLSKISWQDKDGNLVPGSQGKLTLEIPNVTLTQDGKSYFVKAYFDENSYQVVGAKLHVKKKSTAGGGSDSGTHPKDGSTPKHGTATGTPLANTGPTSSTLWLASLLMVTAGITLTRLRHRI